MFVEYSYTGYKWVIILFYDLLKSPNFYKLSLFNLYWWGVLDKLIFNFLAFILVSSTVSAASIIITSDEFFDEVQKLAIFDGSTEVVNISFIDSNYAGVEDNSFVGFNNQNIEGVGEISGYDYSLAKKIISFLRDNSYESITLFGDAKLVPPSYYFYNDVGQNLYDEWIPTDFFYASPDYDLNVDSAIGRIPVTTKEEAEIFVNKMISWLEDDLVVVGAGKITDSVLYKGELAVVDTINKGLLGTNFKKYFESDNKFKRNELMDYFTDGGAGILYIIGHGDGDKMFFQDGVISSRDVLSLEYKTGIPVIISVLCNNGAFDTRLTGKTYSKSFGEAIMTSKAGGIAYLGTARQSYGVPEVEIGNGSVNGVKKDYMTELVDYVLESDEENLGDKIKLGIKKFVVNNDMNDKYNLRTVLEFSLLGDPNLKLKKRDVLAINKPELLIEKDNNFVKVKSSEFANIDVLDVNTDSLVISQHNTKELSFPYSESKVYLIKADNGKEVRSYLGLKEEVSETVVVKKVYVEEQESTGKIHKVNIKMAELRGAVLSCDRSTVLDLRIKNDGQRIENLVLEIKSDDLGIQTTDDIRLEEGDEFSSSYSLQFPSTKQGDYEISVRVGNELVSDSEKVKLAIFDCNQSGNVENRTVSEKVVVPQQVVDVKVENKFFEVVAVMLVMCAVIFSTLAVIFKDKLK